MQSIIYTPHNRFFSKKENTEKPEKEEMPDLHPKDGKDAKKEPTSSSESEEGEVELSSEDIKNIKKLIKDQDESIAKKKSQIEELEKDVKKFKEKLVYQLAENDNTVKRYRKQIEDSKTFAIEKFAKELLDVRDTLGLALEHSQIEKVREMEDPKLILERYEDVFKGQ